MYFMMAAAQGHGEASIAHVACVPHDGRVRNWASGVLGVSNEEVKNAIKNMVFLLLSLFSFGNR